VRILFVHDGFDLYGAGRCLLRLSTRLSSDEHEVKAVLLDDGPASS
jgi:hypothetical protein